MKGMPASPGVPEAGGTCSKERRVEKGPIVSLMHQKWDEVLDGAQAFEPSKRERLRRALDLAQSLLEEFPSPLDWVTAAFRNYSPGERRMPLMVQAPCQTAEEHDDLGWELAQKVLGPVYKATRISMPVTVVGRESQEPPPGGPGCLYVDPSFKS